MKRKVTKVLSVVTIMLALSVLVACGKKSNTVSIDLSKYVKCMTEGYNGYGKVDAEIDFVRIKKDYLSQIKVIATGEAKEEYEFEYESPIDCLEDYVDFDIEVENNGNLSNGDEFSINWDLDEEISDYLNVEFRCSDIEFKVEGLKECKKFDPFQYLSLQYGGVSPNGWVEASMVGNEPYVSCLNFRSKNSFIVANGNTILMEASFANGWTEETFAREYGMVMEETLKEYTISGMCEYLSNDQELTDDILETLKVESLQKILKTGICETEEKNYITKRVSTPKCIGYYRYTAKKESDYCEHGNIVYLVFRADLVFSYIPSGSKERISEKHPLYVCTVVTDVAINDDGKIVVDFDNNLYYPSFQGRKIETDNTVFGYRGWDGDAKYSTYVSAYESLDELYLYEMMQSQSDYDLIVEINEENGEDEPAIENNEDQETEQNDEEYSGKEEIEEFEVSDENLEENNIIWE